MILALLVLQPFDYPWTPTRDLPSATATAKRPSIVEPWQPPEYTLFTQSPSQKARERDASEMYLKEREHVPLGQPVTAVLLYSHQPASLHFQIKHLRTFPWIQEIIIWMDGTQQPLNLTVSQPLHLF